MARKQFSSPMRKEVWVATNGAEIHAFLSLQKLKDHFVKAYPGYHIAWEEVAVSDASGEDIDLSEDSREEQIQQLAGAHFMSKLIMCEAATLSGKYHPRDWWRTTGWYAWRG
jgi:hypothetical protein